MTEINTVGKAPLFTLHIACEQPAEACGQDLVKNSAQFNTAFGLGPLCTSSWTHLPSEADNTTVLREADPNSSCTSTFLPCLSEQYCPAYPLIIRQLHPHITCVSGSFQVRTSRQHLSSTSGRPLPRLICLLTRYTPLFTSDLNHHLTRAKPRRPDCWPTKLCCSSMSPRGRVYFISVSKPRSGRLPQNILACSSRPLIYRN